MIALPTKLCQNGAKFTQILLATWLLTTFVIMKSYEGNLTAMMTVPKIVIPIDSVQDLIHQDEVPWRIISGSFMYDQLKDADTGPFKTLYEKKQGAGKGCDKSCGSLKEGKYALICSEISAMTCAKNK